MDPNDRFVLSKGHAAGALYVTLWSKGLLSDEDLRTFHKDGTRLAGHPPALGIEGVEFATGSLGHGLSLACGLAMAKRLRDEPGRIYCLVSDGELQEGSTWEAVTFGMYRLLPVTVLIDANGLQGFGTTQEIAGGVALEHRGYPPFSIDGHNPKEIGRVCRPIKNFVMVAARTHKGHGISFMEDRMEWHYLPMNAAQYEQAVSEVSRV
jgi:transketolase